jgi:hypothetical protein
VPRGAYLLGGVVRESFTCAPGAAGWRYAAVRADADTGAPLGRVDLVLDRRGRALRLLLASGDWTVRGGVAGAEVAWRRGEQEHVAAAAGFTGSSPGFAVATARLLALEVGQSRRVRLVRLDDAALAGLDVDEAWALTGREDRDGLLVERYEVADLASGERRVVHLAGDIVLATEGAADCVLAELTTPPTLTRS